jgi:disulfide oxidoreductase YuzD
MSKKYEIKWSGEPEEQDYPAALSYLSLIYDKQTAAKCVDKLKRASVSEFKAKDIFRASRLSLLGVSNSHVKKDQQKIQSGQKMSPILLIRDSDNGKVVIADGYHRLCAVYSYDEDAVVPCKIA